MTKSYSIDSISIPKHCPDNWENTSGDKNKRYSGSCGKDVFNLSALSKRSANRLLKKSGGRICVRYARLPNGQTITADRPVYQAARRIGPFAAGLIAVVLLLSPALYSQVTPARLDSIVPAAERPEEAVDGVTSDIVTSGEETSQFRIQVLDSSGVGIPGTDVTLTGDESKKVFRTLTDADGFANFVLIPIGAYEIKTRADGFRAHKQSINLSIAIEPDFEIFLSLELFSICDPDVSTVEFPLFSKVIENDLEAVRSALNSGFDPNKVDSSGQTALYFAVDERKLDMVKLLVRHGAKVNIKTENDETLVTLLAEDVGEDDEAVTEILRFLISKGVDINVQNDNGETILMEAAYFDDPEVVELLLEAGADTTLVDEDDETAYAKIEDERIRVIFHRYGVFK